MIKRLSKGVFRIVIGIMITTAIITTAMAIDKDTAIPIIDYPSAIDPDGGNIASGQTIKGNIDQMEILMLLDSMVRQVSR